MKNLSLSFSPTYLYSQEKSPLFIDPETLAKNEAAALAKLQKVDEKLAAGQLSFVSDLPDEVIFSQIETVLSNISWAKTLVVIGIGGSDLGARVIAEAFPGSGAAKEVLFVGDSTDPVALSRLLSKIDLKQTVFNVVSKSGETLETLATYLFFKAQVLQISQNWAKHFIFTTSINSGLLQKEAATHSVLTMAIPEGVGGRFSVLTAVGLVPALALGVAGRELVAGAKVVATSPEGRALAAQVALTQYYLFVQGIKVVTIMAYATQLQELTRWFRQLWAESLGKNGLGILPVAAQGPADQHSQLQFYAQGTPLSSLLFVQLKNRATNYTLSDITMPEALYLNGKNFNDLINLEAESTATALYEAGRSSAKLEIAELTPRSLGELLMVFELAVVYLAELLEVNVFDQPGVEASKKLVRQALV